MLDLEMTEDELTQLMDDEDLGAIDGPDAQRRIALAGVQGDALIDGYCQGRYSVPFSPVPPIVNGWSATLMAFNLYRNRPKPAPLIDRYNKVMSWLSDIDAGGRAIPNCTESDSYSVPESTTDGFVQTFQRQQRDSDDNVVIPGTMEVW